MIEDQYDIAFVANLARREKQIQQNYRPIIAIHKWFARRPGTLFRSLLLSEFSNVPLHNAFYQTGNLQGKTIGDPFMGGGTPLIEANRMGANIRGCDINPMSYWIVCQETEYLNINKYRDAIKALRMYLEDEIGYFYETRCDFCGNTKARVKYFLWIKTAQCSNCGERVDLFPGYLLAEKGRHPKNVFVCSQCGQLTESADKNNPGRCQYCHAELLSKGPAKNGRCVCRSCGKSFQYVNTGEHPLKHRLFAIEYYCPLCKSSHIGRYFKTPDNSDIEKFVTTQNKISEMSPIFIPKDSILPGVETMRLHRWGYKYYNELFNSRQLLGLEISCRFIAAYSEERVRNALATNLSDLLRYQNMLCRYDTKALKSQDIFSVHGFPVSLVQCESNILGIENGGAPIGSGGWLNIAEKFARAKAYCNKPYEVKYTYNDRNIEKKTIVPISGEWIGDVKKGLAKRLIEINCQNSAEIEWPSGSLDGVFTDPPYFGNVQYAELIDFCYVWLRKLVKINSPAFIPASTRNIDELTENTNMGRGIEVFTTGLAQVFMRATQAMKHYAPFVFTYHHNDLIAYFPIAVAILDSGLICTKTFPCPAEMEASLHIKGTSSATVDTVFVCRKKEFCRYIMNYDLIQDFNNDVEALNKCDFKITIGDKRCILYGNIIKYIINSLAANWACDKIIKDKLDIISHSFASLRKKRGVQLLLNEYFPNHIKIGISY